MLSYYRILGVGPDAGADDLKRAYRGLARRFHPDHNDGNPLAQERFRLVAEAYEVLSDPGKRATYDKHGIQALTRGRDRGGVLGNVERFVANLESRVEARLAQVPRRGEDRRRILTVDLDTACFGGSVEVEITRVGSCSECRGTGAGTGAKHSDCHVCGGGGRLSEGTILKAERVCPFCLGRGRIADHPCTGCDGMGEREATRTVDVPIPAGVQPGRRLVLRGEGQAGSHGAPSGDLYLEIAIAPHPVFEREGEDIRCILPITVVEAVRGGTARVPVLRGEPVTIRIPEGARSGQVLRLRGRGAPRIGREEAGDLLVRLEIETPAVPDAAAERALDLLAKAARHPRREAFDAAVDAT